MSCIHFAFLEQTSKDQLFHLQDEVIPSVSLQTPETPTLLQSRKFEPFKSGKKVLSPTANKLYQSLLKFKKVACINKIRATSYRKQLRLAKQFNIKLKSSVLGSDDEKAKYPTKRTQIHH
jgi:hypothetical protein